MFNEGLQFSFLYAYVEYASLPFSFCCIQSNDNQ
jgi:hypothetical protein